MELCNQIDGLISCRDESSPIGFKGFGSSNSLDFHDLLNLNPLGQITNNGSLDILKGVQAMLIQLTTDMDSKINKLGHDMDKKMYDQTVLLTKKNY